MYPVLFGFPASCVAAGTLGQGSSDELLDRIGVLRTRKNWSCDTTTPSALLLSMHHCFDISLSKFNV